jgi:hypothetical protein
MAERAESRVAGGMSILSASVMGLFSAAALLSGCVSSSVVKPPDAPESLRPPANQVLAFETLATGVQIYECEARRDQSALLWCSSDQLCGAPFVVPGVQICP